MALGDPPAPPAPAQPAAQPVAGISILMLSNGQASVQLTGPSPMPPQFASALLWIAATMLGQAAGALPAAPDPAGAPRIVLAHPGAKIPRV